MSVELNRLDRRLLRLQGPDRPWTILLRLHLSEATSTAALAAAWATVCDHRPELGVRLDGDRVWLAAAEPTPIVPAPVETLLDRPIADSDGRPITLAVDDDPATTVSLIVNHAFTDGLGLSAIADDLVRALAATPLRMRRPVTDAHLEAMTTHRLALAAARRQIPPRRLATLDDGDGPATSVETATASLTDLRSHVESVSAQVLAATHRTLAADPRTLSGTVAVATPADLRRHVGRPDGIGNAVVNLTYAPSDTATATDAARFLEREATARRLAQMLTWILRAARPGPPRRSPRRGRHVSTAVLSNLGLIGRGEHWQRVRSVDFAPPAHQTTSIGVAGFGDELRITVRRRGAADGLAGRIASAVG